MIPFHPSSVLAQANRTRAERIATSDTSFPLFLARETWAYQHATALREMATLSYSNSWYDDQLAESRQNWTNSFVDDPSCPERTCRINHQTGFGGPCDRWRISVPLLLFHLAMKLDSLAYHRNEPSTVTRTNSSLKHLCLLSSFASNLFASGDLLTHLFADERVPPIIFTALVKRNPVLRLKV